MRAGTWENHPSASCQRWWFGLRKTRQLQPGGHSKQCAHKHGQHFLNVGHVCPKCSYTVQLGGGKSQAWQTSPQIPGKKKSSEIPHWASFQTKFSSALLLCMWAVLTKEAAHSDWIFIRNHSTDFLLLCIFAGISSKKWFTHTWARSEWMKPTYGNV